MGRIFLVEKKISLAELASFLGDPFDELVKYVIDVDRGVIALGGELTESLLLGAHERLP